MDIFTPCANLIISLIRETFWDDFRSRLSISPTIMENLPTVFQNGMPSVTFRAILNHLVNKSRTYLLLDYQTLTAVRLLVNFQGTLFPIGMS
jgi:hypothetical protein